VAFFSVLTVVPFFGLSRDALPYTGADVIATAVLWLVALVVMALIFSQTASRYYRRGAVNASSNTDGRTRITAD
jgi:hypothetical protein